MLCPNCGKNMSDDTKFCTACSASMSGAQKTPIHQPQEQPAAQPQATQFDAQPASAPTPTPAPQPVPQPAPAFQASMQSAPVATAQPARTLPLANRLPLIGLILAIIALIMAIVSFIIPGPGSGNLQVVDAGTARIKVQAGEWGGSVRILPANSDLIVIATSIGGDSTFSDVMYNPTDGELVLATKSAQSSEVERSVNWVACRK